jgi:hypothetical protein
MCTRFTEKWYVVDYGDVVNFYIFFMGYNKQSDIYIS